MKKIGLLTHPLSSNFGGILQASVLYNYLADLGFDVVLIQKYPALPFRLKVALKILSHIPFQNIKNIRAGEKSRKQNTTFIEKFIPNRTAKLYTTTQLREMVLAEQLDAIVVGSDQVWRMEYIDDGYFENYFLDFIEGLDIKRIAYAASFGKDYWEAPERNHVVTGLLNKFDAISTREVSGVNICKESFGCIECQVVLDPTLLVDAGFYNRFWESPLVHSESKKITFYILDEHRYKNEVINAVSQEYGLGWELVNAKGNQSLNGVSQWLKSLAEADFVITDSFHGLALSIAFKKNFIVIGNKERGLSRFHSLLGQLGLANRLVLEGTKADIVKLAREEVDYASVDKELEKLRRFSSEFLRQALKVD